jgi:DUF4097 and DUF4098 domain-containing protein YvlB
VWFVLLVSLVVAATADTTDRQNRTIPLPDGRALTIEVSVGSVRVEGWDRADVDITVERRVPSPAHQARLPIVIEDTPARVAVRAVQADGGTDASLRADVTVRAPHAALIESVKLFEGRLTLNGLDGSVTADVRRGPIEATGVAGTLRLETGIGAVTVSTGRLVPGGLVRLRTFNGDVRLRLSERPADARILALALNGGISSTIPLTMKDTWGPRWGEATLGSGQPVISIDVVNGAIEIRSP